MLPFETVSKFRKISTYSTVRSDVVDIKRAITQNNMEQNNGKTYPFASDISCRLSNNACCVVTVKLELAIFLSTYKPQISDSILGEVQLSRSALLWI